MLKRTQIKGFVSKLGDISYTGELETYIHNNFVFGHLFMSNV